MSHRQEPPQSIKLFYGIHLHYQQRIQVGHQILVLYSLLIQQWWDGGLLQVKAIAFKACSKIGPKFKGDHVQPYCYIHDNIFQRGILYILVNTYLFDAFPSSYSKEQKVGYLACLPGPLGCPTFILARSQEESYLEHWLQPLDHKSKQLKTPYKDNKHTQLYTKTFKA